MRFLVAFVLLLVVGALVTMQWLGVFGDTDVPPPTDAGSERAPAAASSTPGTARDAPPSQLVATRAQAPVPPQPTDLSDAPSAWLFVADHATSQPVAGAAVRRVKDGAELVFTDERGIAGVPLREHEQLAVVHDGYLLRLVPTRLGSTEAEPQPVRLVRDDWSFVRRFYFAAPGGNPVAEVFVRFRPVVSGQPARPPQAPGPTGDAVLQRAWNEHGMLAGRPACADVPVQLPAWAEDRVHRLPQDAEVRFVAPGDYTVEAATANGLVGRGDLRIDGKLRVDANALRIMLAPGAFVAGTVADRAASTPIAGAGVTLQGGDPLGLVATSAADGTFRIGPLLPGPVTLHARHGDHEPLAVPVTAPADGVRIALQPLPRTSLRGRVRARPTLQPIPRATVSWQPQGAAVVAVQANADGTFVLPATGEQDARLSVQAPGFVPYAELVAPGSPFAEYDLWPAGTPERLAAGLTAVLEGVVLDAQNRPVGGAAVRLQPAQRSTPAVGVPGRRVLEGGSLELPLATTTGADGAFRLETNQFGPGRLSVAAERAIDVTAVAGRTTSNLQLSP